MLSLKTLSFEALTAPDVENGYSVFLAACTEGNVDMVRSILSFSPSILDTLLALKIPALKAAGPGMLNKTPFDIVKTLGTSSHKVIQKYIEEKTKGMENVSLIHLAARIGSCHHIRKLALIGAKLNQISKNKVDEFSTPLCLAAAYNKTKVLEELIFHGANAYKRNFRGFSPVLLAAKRGNTKNVIYLLDKHPKMKTVAFCNLASVLHLAAREGHTAMVEALLNVGMDVNQNGYISNIHEENDDEEDWDLDQSCINDEYEENLTDFDILSDNCTPLMLAAKSGCIETVKLLISKGAEVQAKDFSGCSALFYACNGGNVFIVKFLIENMNMVANCEDNLGRTILHVSTDVKIAKMLVAEYGLEVNAIDEYLETPLHVAAKAGAVEVAKYLVKCGADVNAKNYQAFNPVTLVIKEKNCKPEMVSVLLDYGSVVYLEKMFSDASEYYDYDLRTFIGQTSVVKIIIDRVCESVNSEICGKTFLHFSSSFSFETTKFLVGYGADVNLQSDNGELPLHVAARVGNIDVVRFLIEQGSEIDVADNRGMTPLFTAAQRSHSDVVMLLFHYSDSIYITNQEQNTLLHIAAKMQLNNVVVKLLDDQFLKKKMSACNLDVKSFIQLLLRKQNKHGRTALHEAVLVRNNTEVVATLLEHGSEICFLGSERETVMHCAISSRDLKMVQFVVNHAAKTSLNKRNDTGDTPLHSVFQLKLYWDKDTVIQLIRLLTANNCDVNSTNNSGRTALHLAAPRTWYSYGDNTSDSVLKYLMELGCDSSAKDFDGKTALHYAAQTNAENCTDILQYEANAVNGEKLSSLHIRDNKGRTPLHMASIPRHYYMNQQMERIILLLLNYGANIEAKDQDGKTPLHYAAGTVQCCLTACIY